MPEVNWSPTCGTRRNQRGMVTAEIAIASIVLAAVLVVGLQIVGVGLQVAHYYDTAAEVARHLSRGDQVAADAAGRRVGDGGFVAVSREGRRITVRISGPARIAGGLASIPVSAEARTLVEPGVP